MNFMLSPIHEIIIAPVYTTQTNSWNDISKAVKFFEFDIELYRVVGCEVGCASTFHTLGLCYRIHEKVFMHTRICPVINCLAILLLL